MNKTKFISLTASLVFTMAFIFSCSSGDDPNPGGDKGNDIENYKTEVIGNQTWMAENLNYDVKGSKCYGEDGVVMDLDDRGEFNPMTAKTLTDKEVKANCAKYGRLYDWATAMGFDQSCNSAICANLIKHPHRGVCPQGWHIPSGEEWGELIRFVDNENDGIDEENNEEGNDYYQSYTAGRYLKATSGWRDHNGNNSNGTDKYRFSAMPGGMGGYLDGVFGYAEDGIRGVWWSSTESMYDEDEYDDAKGSLMGSCDGSGYPRSGYNCAWYEGLFKSALFSVRCVQD